MLPSAPKQNAVLELLLESGRMMSLREITNHCELTYHQVASVLTALSSKGYVRRVRTGIYAATEDARLVEDPDRQIAVLKLRIEELERTIEGLLTRMVQNPYLHGKKES
jgi:predicted DNA-binding transcriptional regulator